MRIQNDAEPHFSHGNNHMSFPQVNRREWDHCCPTALSTWQCCTNAGCHAWVLVAYTPWDSLAEGLWGHSAVKGPPFLPSSFPLPATQGLSFSTIFLSMPSVPSTLSHLLSGCLIKNVCLMSFRYHRGTSFGIRSLGKSSGFRAKYDLIKSFGFSKPCLCSPGTWDPSKITPMKCDGK